MTEKGMDYGGKGMSAVKRGLMTVEQFAETVGLKPATVRQKIWRREIEFVRIGRAIRFKPETAEKLIEAGTVLAREAR
jgi:excisionase family DNA binding protein